ncbi:2311_t:CDS:2 [Funneliformis caledonium]|uniref:2311_t:CDS:1 n=1 Tax=Funneliformis caledonium TaxID=1117310 RepID=A0A9N9B6J7_9GLOM|nr:2311_t:CDS:2 [Funneliformis caledonium]
MPVKLTFICVIHSVSEKDSLDYVIREAISIIRREDNESLDVRITAFFPKSSSIPKWVPIFVPENILRFTEKEDIYRFATEPVQSDNELFKSIKILVTEFIKGGSSGKKFLIKCRYLKSDERIDKKLRIWNHCQPHLILHLPFAIPDQQMNELEEYQPKQWPTRQLPKSLTKA